MNSREVNASLLRWTDNEKLQLTCENFNDEYGYLKARVHLHVGSKAVKFWETDGHCDDIAVSHAIKFAKVYYAKGEKMKQMKKSILHRNASEIIQKMQEVLGIDMEDIEAEFGEIAPEVRKMLTDLDKTAKKLSDVSR